MDWYSEPPNGYLQGHRLWFKSPEDGSNNQVAVTIGSHPVGVFANENIWNIRITKDSYIVAPSIHFIGHFHSPNPVVFKRVETMEEL
jgi:hypothetical protein